MTIHIEDLCFDTVIGILSFERTAAQRVIIDCHIKYDYLDNFIDYAQVVTLIKTVMQKEAFDLIERALTVLIFKIKELFPAILHISLKITKPDIIEGCFVSVSEERSFL